MTTAHDLLSRGYFPKELPPPFSSLEFANRTLGAVGGTPANFLKIEKSRTSPCMHNYARVGTLRRRLAICHPVPQYNLCVLIEKNWARLNRLAQSSPYSQSKPTYDSERALTPKGELLPKLRAKHRATARFVLNADVARFYHSVYTHSIPWAIHGKRIAKRNRKDTLLGNRIDHWVRNGQDGQTMGLPIGPDTSLLIAEVLLAAVDKRIKRKVPRARAFRFIDDYELVASSRHNAERALAAIQEAMADYEIALNPEKTVITELPTFLDDEWVELLRDFTISTRASRQTTELIAFFNRAYSLVRQYPNKQVLAYAVARLRSVDIVRANWEIFQDLLFQCVLLEAGTFHVVLWHLAKYSALGYPVDLPRLADVMNLQIAYQAPLGHASEVAWALWATLTFGLLIRPAVATAVSSMSDSVVALLALDARAQGLITSGLDTDLWESFLTQQDLNGEHWLLSYESAVKGWLRPTVDHIGADANFSWLRALGVEFYDRPTTATPTAAAPDTLRVSERLTAIVDALVDPYGVEQIEELAGQEYDWLDMKAGGEAGDDDPF